MASDRERIVIGEHLSADYGEGLLRVPVLADASFVIERGRVTAVTGPSGSGKTTLLSLIGGLDRPSGGSLVVDGQELTSMGRSALVEFRRRRVGFVFQSFHLIPTLTARENVEAGLEPLGLRRAEARRAADAALDAVGLLDVHHRFPNELSGGEQQRVAVARACAKEPPLLLADEPTGNLDEQNGARILDLLTGPARGHDARRTLVVVTHDATVASRADAVLALHAHRVLSGTESGSRLNEFRSARPSAESKDDRGPKPVEGGA
jgi:putative ABC transport system ATP-binding protein